MKDTKKDATKDAMTVFEDITDGALLEDLVAAFKHKRHPGDHYDPPSDEQMEYLKRGGR